MQEQPHPLAQALADRMRSANAQTPRFALLLGGGSGRNVPPLLAAHLHVDVLEEDAARAQTLRERLRAQTQVRVMHGSYVEPNVFEQRYDAALSTHALLHGSPASVSAALHALRQALLPGAEMMLTLGCANDPRCGTGTRINEQTWAPQTGEERGVPHVYYDRAQAAAQLGAFTLLSLHETRVEEIVGKWAHERGGAPETVHWFAHVKKSEK